MTPTAAFTALGLASQSLFLAFFAARRWAPDVAGRIGRLAYAFASLGLVLGAWLIAAGAGWELFVGPLLLGAWALGGAYVDLVRRVEWRMPVRWGVLVPYVACYFWAQMFLWWPLWDRSRPAWWGFLALFVANTGLNLRGHADAGAERAETTDERIRRLAGERIDIVAYDPSWPARFLAEKEALARALPEGMAVRIEHVGSTAVPGMDAKPIVDVLVVVRDLAEVRERVAPLLQSLGYEYLWRPFRGDATPPYYAWFVKRDPETGARTHHIHMAEEHMSPLLDAIVFRDWLIAHPDAASQYASLKRRLAAAHPRDREAYTLAKTAFIEDAVARAKGLG